MIASARGEREIPGESSTGRVDSKEFELGYDRWKFLDHIAISSVILFLRGPGVSSWKKLKFVTSEPIHNYSLFAGLI